MPKKSPKRKKFEYKDEYIPASRLRDDLFNVLDYVEGSPIPVKVSKGSERFVLVSEDEYDDLIDTMDMLSDKKFMEDLKDGIAQIKRGETVAWEDVKKESAL